MTAVKENEKRKEEEDKRNKREMAKIASQAAKDKKLSRAPLSKTILLEDESEDVIETMLESLQSGGGNQVKLIHHLHFSIEKLFLYNRCIIFFILL